MVNIDFHFQFERLTSIIFAGVLAWQIVMGAFETFFIEALKPL